jgi:hypothetical protein
VVIDEAKLRELSVRCAGLLSGKTVATVDFRCDGCELFVEFDDGTRLFVNAQVKLDLSITEGIED